MRRLGIHERIRRRICHEMWNVGVVNQSAADIVTRGIVGPVRWFSGLPSHTIFADPSCLQYPDGRRTIFLEAMDLRGGRGEIWSADLAPDEDAMPVSFKLALRAPYHLSYPFPFFDDAGRPLLTLESWQAAKVTIWQRSRVQWQQISTIMDDRPVLDPTLWRGSDKWWLFCTFHDDGADSRLHVFFADRLDGPWTSHPRNPVIEDFGAARPAGPLFMAGDRLIRPAQDCSRTYGGAVVLNAVRRITTEEYVEVPVRRLEPQPGLYPRGLHTFCPAGGVTFIDGKTWRFDPLELSCRIHRKISAIARRA